MVKVFLDSALWMLEKQFTGLIEASGQLLYEPMVSEFKGFGELLGLSMTFLDKESKGLRVLQLSVVSKGFLGVLKSSAPFLRESKGLYDMGF